MLTFPDTSFLQVSHVAIVVIASEPSSYENASIFFQLIDMQYEKCSTLFTTNASFISDILHHATVVTKVGHSYCLKDHTKRKKTSDFVHAYTSENVHIYVGIFIYNIEYSTKF
jgi:hypothetical protein